MDLILPASLLANAAVAVASTTVVAAAANNRRPSKRAAPARVRGARHQCRMCPKSFASPSQLEEHFTYRHSDARTHACSLCSKVFKTKSNLNQHLRTHVGNRFRCAACPEARPFTESGYRYHLLTRHSDDAVRRRFRCDLCPPGKARSFAQNKLLQKHVASCHSDERKHECPHCPMTFKRADHLARHVSDTHSLVDNLFECSVVEDCGARFQSQRRLRQHESHHHRASSANLSKCDECGKVFSKRANLDKHFQQSHVKVEAGADVFTPASAVAEDIVSGLYAEGESSTTPSSLAGSSEGSSEGGGDLDEELQSLLLDGFLVGDQAVDHIAVEDLFA